MTTYTKEIKSLQHPIVKHLVKLRKKRGYRLEKESLLLEGKKMVFEYRGHIEVLLVAKNTTIPSHLKPKQTLIVSPEIIEKISGTCSPEPYLAEIPFPSLSSLEGKERLLALDGVSDPGNVGTLLRTALALGFEGVFLTKTSADPFMDKALRAAKGATFHLSIQVGSEKDLTDLIERCGLTPYVADGSGASNVSFTSPLILILGNEAHGPSETLKKLGTLVSIPMANQTESLNVAIAGGILMNKIQDMLWQR